ncbi:MAG: signal peptide peptidase SppA [Verrucomicrobiota bacterium]
MNKKFIGCLGIFLVLALGMSLFFNLILLMATAGSSISTTSGVQYFEKNYVSGYGSDEIAIVPMYGMISYGVPGDVMGTMVDDTLSKLRQAREDNNIKAIILRIDSPGGEVTASDVIYHEVVKTDLVKPVIVYMDSVAASGGYYVAVGGRHLMANELTITGSIGVIIQTMNFEKLSEKVGVDVLTIKSGEMKDMLNPFREAKPEELEFVQNMIDETYDKFLGIVADERGLDANQLRDTVADGRIVSGKTALEVGLIDGTGYFEDAIAQAEELAGLEHARVISIDPPFSLGRLFRVFGATAEARTEVNIKLGPESLNLEAGKFYYVSPHLFSH